MDDGEPNCRERTTSSLAAKKTVLGLQRWARPRMWPMAGGNNVNDVDDNEGEKKRCRKGREPLAGR